MAYRVIFKQRHVHKMTHGRSLILADIGDEAIVEYPNNIFGSMTVTNLKNNNTFKMSLGQLNSLSAKISLDK